MPPTGPERPPNCAVQEEEEEEEEEEEPEEQEEEEEQQQQQKREGGGGGGGPSAQPRGPQICSLSFSFFRRFRPPGAAFGPRGRQKTIQDEQPVSGT